MNLKLPINGFDMVLLVVVALGVLRGRKRGMSEELLGMVEWMLVVVACAFLYEPAGRFLAGLANFSLLSSFVLAYIIIALAVVGVFVLVKRALGGKLLGSDIFGRAEYYLGMGSGLVKFACVLLCGLALLNARYFSSKEIKDMHDFQNEVYGSNFFPTLQSAQATVFQDSLTGPWIKTHLAVLLIKPTAPEGKEYHQQEYALPQ